MSKARTKRRYLAVRRYWSRVLEVTGDDRRIELPSFSRRRRRYLKSLGARARAKDVNRHLAKARDYYDNTCTATGRPILKGGVYLTEELERRLVEEAEPGCSEPSRSNDSATWCDRCGWSTNHDAT